MRTLKNRWQSQLTWTFRQLASFFPAHARTPEPHQSLPSAISVLHGWVMPAQECICYVKLPRSERPKKEADNSIIT